MRKRNTAAPITATTASASATPTDGKKEKSISLKRNHDHDHGNEMSSMDENDKYIKRTPPTQTLSPLLKKPSSSEYNAALCKLLFPRSSFSRDIRNLSVEPTCWLSRIVDQKTDTVFYMTEDTAFCIRRICIVFTLYAVNQEFISVKYGASIWLHYKKPEDLPAKLVAQAAKDEIVPTEIDNVPWSKANHRNTAWKRFHKNPVFLRISVSLLNDCMHRVNMPKYYSRYPNELIGCCIRAKGVRYGCSATAVSLLLNDLE